MIRIRVPRALLAVVALVALVAGVAYVLRPEPPDPDVLVIGDSLTVLAQDRGLARTGWLVDARSGRRLEEAARVARERHAAEVPTVVVAVGSGDRFATLAAVRARLGAVMDAIGPAPRVVWVNADTRTPQLATGSVVNDALADLPARYPNVCVADWDAYVAGIAGFDRLRAADGIHYGPEGSAIRADWTLLQGLGARGCVNRAQAAGS